MKPTTKPALAQHGEVGKIRHEPLNKLRVVTIKLLEARQNPIGKPFLCNGPRKVTIVPRKETQQTVTLQHLMVQRRKGRVPLTNRVRGHALGHEAQICGTILEKSQCNSIVRQNKHEP